MCGEKSQNAFVAAHIKFVCIAVVCVVRPASSLCPCVCLHLSSLLTVAAAASLVVVVLVGAPKPNSPCGNGDSLSVVQCALITLFCYLWFCLQYFLCVRSFFTFSLYDNIIHITSSHTHISKLHLPCRTVIVICFCCCCSCCDNSLMILMRGNRSVLHSVSRFMRNGCDLKRFIVIVKHI